MAFTTTAISDVAKTPGGGGIPYAVVVSYPNNGFANAGSNAAAHSTIAASNGVFSLTSLECTDDAASTVVDPDQRNSALSSPVGMFTSAAQTGATATNHVGTHHIMIFDPETRERVLDGDYIVPSSTGKPTNLATLALCAI